MSCSDVSTARMPWRKSTYDNFAPGKDQALCDVPKLGLKNSQSADSLSAYNSPHLLVRRFDSGLRALDKVAQDVERERQLFLIGMVAVCELEHLLQQEY
jgi:hypothetical protein